MQAPDRRLLSLLAERDAGEGVPFSTTPSVVSPAAGPRPLLLDRDTRAALARLKASGLVEERAVAGEAVIFALTEPGRRRAGRRPRRDDETEAPAPRSSFWVKSVIVPAAVSAATVLVLRALGL